MLENIKLVMDLLVLIGSVIVIAVVVISKLRES